MCSAFYGAGMRHGLADIMDLAASALSIRVNPP